MNLRKIISAIMAATIVASTTTIYSAAADIVETNSIESVFADIDFTEPSVEISTDIIDGYTSIIFSIPAEKIELFKQVKTDNDSRINLKMTVCFGDLSPERDEDVELPMSAYSVAAYLYDLPSLSCQHIPRHIFSQHTYSTLITAVFLTSNRVHQMQYNLQYGL